MCPLLAVAGGRMAGYDCGDRTVGGKIGGFVAGGYRIGDADEPEGAVAPLLFR